MQKETAGKRKSTKPSAVGAELQSIREKMKKTREDVAKEIGISPGYLKTIERRGGRPALQVCQNLATAYGLDWKELMVKFHPDFDISSLREPKSQPRGATNAGGASVAATTPTNHDELLAEFSALLYESRLSMDLLMRGFMEYRNGNFDKVSTLLFEYLQRQAKHEAVVLRIVGAPPPAPRASA
jgi:transcriptional regulator with XRE-family HTH domain